MTFAARASWWLAIFVCWQLLDNVGFADEKADPLQARSHGAATGPHKLFARPVVKTERGTRMLVGDDEKRLPVVVVEGTPYEMGLQLGRLMQREIQLFIPVAMAGITHELNVSLEALCEVWARTASYADDRVEQELAGLADGSQVPLKLLQAAHAAPLMMPYSCSSIAAWGDATEDGHLYHTRNLDWSLEVKAHEFPVVVIYLPKEGIPHVVPSFAGMIGAHTGMNLRGITLAEMGDSPAKEMPYQVHAPHFTIFFRTLLYDAQSSAQALDIFRAQPLTKRYHFVFGDGRQEQRAVKIRAHSPEEPGQQLAIWSDNDPQDEFAPQVLPGVVYNDEGRGAFPILRRKHGKLNGEELVDLANQIPIKGGNVVNVVYDATDLRLWVSYAKGDQEAYQRPYVYLDLKTLDTDQDGNADFRIPGR